MVDADLAEFTELLDTTMAVVSGGRYKPDGKQVGLWFALLRPYPLHAVTAALHAHLTTPLTGRTLPIPADVIAQLQAMTNDDGRPAVEEAWAIALLTRDEGRTVVWTEEIASAWGVARVVMPDEVGARMAFKDAYARLVGDARRAGRPVRWTATLGHDTTERTAALKAAAELGRRVQMAGADDLAQLPAPRQAVALLTGPASGVPEHARQALQALRDRLTAPRPYVPGPDVEGRRRTAELRDAAVRQVADYADAQGIELHAAAAPATPTAGAQA